MNHPFILRCHGAFQNSEYLFIVLDFATGGELFFHMQKVKCFPENVAKMIIAQLLLALQALHEKKIIMRDLKPENVLMFDDGYIKLADFGLSKIS